MEHVITDINHTVIFRLAIDANEDTWEIITKKVRYFLKFLETKRDNVLLIAKSLYILRKFGDKIYKGMNCKALSSKNCTFIYNFIKEQVTQFVQTPVNGSNLYLYDSILDKWILVSPKGHLWLIYGSAQRRIHLVGLYLKELLNEYDSSNNIDLKCAEEFVNKILIQISRDSSEPILTTVLDDEIFTTNYNKLTVAIAQHSARINNENIDYLLDTI